MLLQTPTAETADADSPTDSPKALAKAAGTYVFNAMDFAVVSPFAVKGAMRAVAASTHLPKPPYLDGACWAHTYSTIKLKRELGGGYGSGILAINAKTLRGGYLREENNSITMQDDFPSGYPTKVIAFFEGAGGGGFFEETRFNAKLQKVYQCP